MPGVLIDICSACRSRCRYCLSQNGGHRNAAVMTYAAFRRTVDIVRADGYDVLHMYLSGEPLLHPQFAELLEYARRSGFARIEVATKLQAQPNWDAVKLAMEIDGSPVRWLVGVDGSNQETLIVTCPGANFVLLWVNLAALATCGGELLATTVRTTYTEPVIDDIRAMCERLGYRWFDRDLGTNNTDLATADDVDWFRRAIPLGNPRLRTNGTIDGMPKSLRTAPCRDVLEPSIHPNGDVSLCCHDQLGRGTVGNVIEAGSLKAILQSQQAREMLAQCRAMTAPFCMGCS